MGNPPPGTTRLDPAIQSRAGLMMRALPFAIIASIGVSRMVIGPGYLAKAAFAVALIDHPAIGKSDMPNDLWLLSPETVAAIEVSAVQRLVAGLGFGSPP